MANNAILPGASYLGSAAGNILGTGGSNTSTAANSVFNVGQFQPYSINNPLGQTSFSGGTANTTMSPLQSQLSGQFGTQISNNLSGPSASYNPNTSFLPQQYQSIFGNMQGNVNSMFNSLQTAQQPFTQQYLQSNLDNEFSKGTLASTAGAYQTAGAQTAANSQMNSNMAQAQQYALNNANAQFGAASNTAQQGEQQSEFAPSFAQSQTQGLYGNLLNAGSLMNQQTSLGGSLGALQSNANTNAAMPSFQAAQQQDQAQSGLLNGLLTGNGTGGLLGSLLGTSNGSGGAQSGGLLSSLGGSAGNFLNGLFGGTGSGANMTNQQYGNLLGGSASNPTGETNFQTPDQQQNLTNDQLAQMWGGNASTNGSNDLTSLSDSGGLDQQLNDSNDQLLQELGFNGAGGQATNPQSLEQALAFNDQELTQLYGAPNLAPPSPSSSPNLFGAAGSALNFGLAANAGSGLGMAGSATGLASALGAPSSITSPVGTGVSLASLGMNMASGNVLGAVGGALGLGGKAGIPSYITQPLALALSALSGNPIGMAVGAYNVGKGILNKIEGNQWNGNLLPDQSELESNTDQMVNADLGVQPTPSNPGLAAWGASQAQNFDTSAYMQENAGNYSGQPTQMMNQGESEIPIAPMSEDVVNFLNQLPSGYFSNG